MITWLHQGVCACVVGEGWVGGLNILMPVTCTLIIEPRVGNSGFKLSVKIKNIRVTDKKVICRMHNTYYHNLPFLLKTAIIILIDLPAFKT